MMKNKGVFGIVILMLITTTVFAQKHSACKMTKKVAVKNFNTLVVKNKVSIVLIEHAVNDSLSIEGNKRYLEGVKVFQIGKTLIVSGKQHNNLRKKGIIYIPVRSLQSLQVNTSANIVSQNILQSPALNLFINGTCTVNLMVNGKISIREGDGYETSFTRVPANSQLPLVKN